MSDQVMSLDSILEKSFGKIEAKYHTRTVNQELCSGISELDYLLNGFHKSELITIGSRPGVGKTTLALSFFLNMIKNGKKALYISTEQKEISIFTKLLSIESHINMQKIESGLLKISDFENLQNAGSILYKNNHVFIKSVFNVNIIDIKSLINDVIVNHQIDIVFLDYITMITSSQNYQNRWEQVSDVSRNLKSIAMEFNIPIIALCPINRFSINKKPEVSELSESGSIEYESDKVILLRNTEDKDCYDSNSFVTMYIMKNRNGPTGVIDLKINFGSNTIEINKEK